jgi:CRISPR-associated exonuclease Cas4
MYIEDDLLPISALQHLQFCQRQCALIHIEQIWEENLFTAQGRVVHERVHEEGVERRRDIRIEHGISLRSLRLGLTGKADIVEFHRQENNVWAPFPVEYKRGRNKLDNCDTVQLCAQAMCLEEMTRMYVPQGAIYYGKERRRTEVVFDETLRQETENSAKRLHEFIWLGKTPPPIYESKCDACSLLNLCMPKTMQDSKTVDHYLKRMIDQIE